MQMDPPQPLATASFPHPAAQLHNVYSVSAIKTALAPYPVLAADLDALFTAWLAGHRVPFIHGSMAANPALTITGLSRTSVSALLSNLIRHASQNSARRTQGHMPPPPRLPSHTEAFFFPDYPSLLAHLRAQTYANKKTVQLRKRQVTLDAAKMDFEAARTLIHPGHWPPDCPPQPLAQRCPQPSADPTAILDPYEFDHRKITEVGYTVADIVPWTALRNERIPLAPGDHWIALPNSTFHRPPPPPQHHSHYDPSPHMVTPPRSPPDDDHLDDHDPYLLHHDQQSHDWVLLVRPRHIIFAFLGTSATLPLTAAMSHLANIMHSADAVVGHALQSDAQFLRKGCPDVRVTLSARVFDTQVIFKALTNSLDMYDAARLHNAGNDAVFSLYALLRLVGVGETLPSTALQVVLAEDRRGGGEDAEEVAPLRHSLRGCRFRDLPAEHVPTVTTLHVDTFAAAANDVPLAEDDSPTPTATSFAAAPPSTPPVTEAELETQPPPYDESKSSVQFATKSSSTTTTDRESARQAALSRGAPANASSSSDDPSSNGIADLLSRFAAMLFPKYAPSPAQVVVLGDDEAPVELLVKELVRPLLGEEAEVATVKMVRG
ncbi:hypothetical protein BCR44DRAFT_1423986 [Catenaria anguillulae PL171]|uniref:Gfd2/YDR514C-like C-terminal domain-containing protein n=1 Tax=Catenaria anguillulae PL171 TaxID=765915 RepID=A0A1Y2I4J6_9FUNG|nr:hypothetical protein BCR44DRAFT_1423986 [Catenaria anguillulae PL171]